MHIVVTGAAGFIGSHVARALLARGDRVLGVDDVNDFYDPKIKREALGDLVGEGMTFREGNVRDEAVLDDIAAAAPDAVIHLAAYAGVRPSIQNPLLYQRENIEATVRLLHAAAAMTKRPKFVFASSSSVYGNSPKVPFHEDDRVDHPISPYAATKKAGELWCAMMHDLYDLDVTALRFFTVYGPGQRPDLAIHKFALQMMRGEAIHQYGDGTTSRDYTYIDDIVAGVLSALDACAGYNVYNLGGDKTVTLKEMIAAVGDAVGMTPTIELHPMQPGDVTRTCADISRARTELGYAPQTPFPAGMAAFGAWFRARHGLDGPASAG